MTPLFYCCATLISAFHHNKKKNNKVLQRWRVLAFHWLGPCLTVAWVCNPRDNYYGHLEIIRILYIGEFKASPRPSRLKVLLPQLSSHFQEQKRSKKVSELVQRNHLFTQRKNGSLVVEYSAPWDFSAQEYHYHDNTPVVVSSTTANFNIEWP